MKKIKHHIHKFEESSTFSSHHRQCFCGKYELNVDVKIALANRMKEIRKKNYYSQKKLANVMNVSQQYISGIETYRENINIDFLKDFSRSLNLKLEILLHEIS